MRVRPAGASGASRPARLSLFWAERVALGVLAANFRALIPRAKLVVVMTRGIYLARRWDEDGQLNLYYVANRTTGFFVETRYQVACNEVVVWRSFRHPSQLAPYLAYLHLPKGF